jgi:hypothetical protein
MHGTAATICGVLAQFKHRLVSVEKAPTSVIKPCRAAVEVLEKSDELLKGNALSFNDFLLPMSHWQLGNKDEARKRYDEALAWMEKNAPQDDELRRFRVEAEELLKIEKPINS